MTEAQNGTRVECVQHRDGWCAVKPDRGLDPDATTDETVCDHIVIMRLGSRKRQPTCHECIVALEATR